MQKNTEVINTTLIRIPKTRTHTKIGKTTFVVTSFFSQEAKDNVSVKIDNLIKRELS